MLFLRRAALPALGLPKHFLEVSLRLCSAEAESNKNFDPEDERKERTLNVAIIGVPNAGKSTLINNLIDKKACPVSCKVHTTKRTTEAIFTKGDAQIVFVDTPGMVGDRDLKKYDLKKPIEDLRHRIKTVDMIGAIHDISHPKTRMSLDRSIRTLLTKHEGIPSFLILNKIDLMKTKKHLLEITRLLCNNRIAGNPISQMTKPPDEATLGRGFGGFSDVFMVSALEIDGLDAIKDYLVKHAKPGKWKYRREDWTDQSPERLVIDTVRGKLLDFLPQEIPYTLKCDLELFDESPRQLCCSVLVHCPSQRIEGLISGRGGGRLKQISDSCRFDLLNMFEKDVSLTLTLYTTERSVRRK